MLFGTSVATREVFSPKLDFVAFTLPILVALIAAPILYLYVPHDAMPIWGYIIIVAFTDVGHVWTTTLRTHFDSEENARRWVLYNVFPALLLIVSIVIHYFSEAFFWTLLGYLAIYHFVKQQYGMLALLKFRGVDSRVDWNFDRRCLYGGALCPILMWHSDATRKFDWFNRDDPIVLPLHHVPYAFECFLGLWLLLIITFSVRQYQLSKQGYFNQKKFQFVLSAWLTWGVGVLLNHKLIALTFLNLFHALPAFIIVFCYCKNRWNKNFPLTGSDSFVKWLCVPERWPVYAAVFMLVGIVEEFLWESMVWHDYTADIFTWDPRERFGDFGYSIVTCILTLPQSSHYALDAFIWKQGKDPETGEDYNPGLKTYLGMDRPKS